VNDSTTKKDEKLISKYINDLIKTFNTAISAEEDPPESPEWLIENIAEVVNKVVPPPKGPLIFFDTSNDSLMKNTKLLVSYYFDLNRLIESNRLTTLDFRSEFRPIADLEKILGDDPKSPFFKEIYDGLRCLQRST